LIGTTSACALKLFKNVIALEKDEEQVNFIKMRIQGLWECPDEDLEVGVKHIAQIDFSKLHVNQYLHWLVDINPESLLNLKTTLLRILLLYDCMGRNYK
jgi:hypothetical protein